MSYAFTLDVPANAEMYGKIRGKLGDAAPKGLVAHVVHSVDGGLRYIDVWNTKRDWEEFRATTLLPAVTEVLAGYGIEHNDEETTLVEVEAIDTWLGA